MDSRTDFGDRQPLPGHCAVLLDIPENLPAKFRRPAQYILAAVRRKFEILHAFCHERCVVLMSRSSMKGSGTREPASPNLCKAGAQTPVTSRLVKETSVEEGRGFELRSNRGSRAWRLRSSKAVMGAS